MNAKDAVERQRCSAYSRTRAPVFDFLRGRYHPNMAIRTRSCHGEQSAVRVELSFDREPIVVSEAHAVEKTRVDDRTHAAPALQ